MGKSRDIELRDRALRLLAVDSMYDLAEIKRNFRRQLKLVNPHGPRRLSEEVPGYSNAEIARLLIQAYKLLTSSRTPTTLLEDDDLVGVLLNGDITPIEETTTAEDWSANRFYDQFRHSIWPEASADDLERSRQKFRGCC